MSGVFCGGCGEGGLLPDAGGKGQDPVKCDLCGWTADASELSRKWRVDDGGPWDKRERKQAGKLFFLWIDAEGDALDQAMERLGQTSWSVAPRVLVELETRPTEETLDGLRKIRGVARVWLAP